MGLMERLKSTAQDLALETKKATAQAQGKLEEVALRRRMDDAARRLGYLVFRERAKGTPAGSNADEVLQEMRALDEQMTAQEAAQRAAEPSQGPGGDEPSPRGSERGDEAQAGGAPSQPAAEERPPDEESR
jgi:hypothetical protein